MVEPLKDCPLPTSEDVEEGEKLLKVGGVGCILLAGGEGSRLGWGEPKGSFPIQGKSLFEILVEKVLKSSKRYKKKLQLAIMTSPRNDFATREFFAENNNFGLGKDQFDFFTQEMEPLLDLSKKPLDEKGPAGNGKALHLLCLSGLFEKWQKKGVELISVVPIDNPLANPFDPSFLGAMRRTGADVGVRAVKRNSPAEEVGVLGQKEGKLAIIEYSELQGGENWPLAHTGLLAFTMDFAKRVRDQEMPIHYARRERDGKEVLKQETFLFELLAFAESPIARLYPRESCFAPLKSPEDIESVCDAYALSVNHSI
ncbi:MAG: putative uridylyltransferase [Chlamydiae bacterium]|nr:putative uridylyltransferase [Chlamydiota bacterium]